MRYMLLVGADEQADALRSAEEGAAIFAKYGEWMNEMGERGVLQGGERLHPSSDTTTVRVRGGETLTSDGPFVETKEQIGGYFVVDCKDLDEAIEISAQLPAAASSAIEVRPIWEM
jgi:hypothetical protein